eukprot:2308326-Prymnesium_polylepis.1
MRGRRGATHARHNGDADCALPRGLGVRRRFRIGTSSSTTTRPRIRGSGLTRSRRAEAIAPPDRACRAAWSRAERDLSLASRLTAHESACSARAVRPSLRLQIA